MPIQACFGAYFQYGLWFNEAFDDPSGVLCSRRDSWDYSAYSRRGNDIVTARIALQSAEIPEETRKRLMERVPDPRER